MAEPLLRVEGLVKRFGALAATDGASFEVQPGELHALIGPNGAGKTTLIHQISGALRPDAGRIEFAGQDLSHTGMAARVRAGLVRSYQITSVFKRLSVLDNLRLAVQARRPGVAFWRAAASDGAARDEAMALLGRVGLAARAEQAAGSLAHGEQRQLELGLALAARPRLLLLDEPLAGMGVAEAERMVELLLRLKKDHAMLLVEHDMDAIFALADHLTVMVNGQVIASGAPADVRADANVQAAYLGEEH